MNDLSTDIRMYRAKNRLKQNELAEMCGITTVTLCNIENEKYEPKKTTEAKIRKVIGGKPEEEKDFIDRIIEYRAEHNLNHKVFAKMCGISTQTLYSAEKREQKLGEITKGKILKVIENDMPEEI